MQPWNGSWMVKCFCSRWTDNKKKRYMRNKRVCRDAHKHYTQNKTRHYEQQMKWICVELRIVFFFVCKHVHKIYILKFGAIVMKMRRSIDVMYVHVSVCVWSMNPTIGLVFIYPNQSAVNTIELDVIHSNLISMFASIFYENGNLIDWNNNVNEKKVFSSPIWVAFEEFVCAFTLPTFQIGERKRNFRQFYETLRIAVKNTISYLCHHVYKCAHKNQIFEELC